MGPGGGDAEFFYETERFRALMMDQFLSILTSYGGLGMFVAAFLAGSFFPFSSEVVMLALLSAGVDPGELLLWGTGGNVLGSLFNYGVGSLGRPEWIQKRWRISPEKFEKAQKLIRRFGPWAGFLAWLPVLGSVITIALGFMRANLLFSMLAISMGKYLRYLLLLRAYLLGLGS